MLGGEELIYFWVWRCDFGALGGAVRGGGAVKICRGGSWVILPSITIDGHRINAGHLNRSENTPAFCKTWSSRSSVSTSQP